jgi:hypothetical protein
MEMDWPGLESEVGLAVKLRMTGVEGAELLVSLVSEPWFDGT